jgi:hypothetical protein
MIQSVQLIGTVRGHLALGRFHRDKCAEPIWRAVRALCHDTSILLRNSFASPRMLTQTAMELLSNECLSGRTRRQEWSLVRLVWVAILRDTCVLVDISEEDVPDLVIETAQGIPWETTDDNHAEQRQVG